MDMSYIMDSGQNKLHTTFPSISGPAGLSKKSKKKSRFFESKMCSRGAKSGSIGIAR